MRRAPPGQGPAFASARAPGATLGRAGACRARMTRWAAMTWAKGAKDFVGAASVGRRANAG
eukprot:7208265-Pyramimonas_sp.AAC.1